MRGWSFWACVSADVEKTACPLGKVVRDVEAIRCPAAFDGQFRQLDVLSVTAVP